MSRIVSREWGALVLVWIALAVLFGILADRFVSVTTLATVAGRLPALAVVAAGLTLVIISGGIDLSVGSVMALAGAVLGVAVVRWQWALAAAIPLAMLTGAAAGLASGLITVGWRIPSFLVTLGSLEICRGLTYAVSDSRTLFIGAAIRPLAQPLPWLGVPVTVPVAIAVIVIAQLILTRTVFGRHLVAIGANEPAVRLAGIDTATPRVAVFVISGALAGLAAVFASARLGSADPNAGTGLELAAIAAVVIGGTSLSGGTGSVVGSLLGVLIIATLEAGLAQLGASEPIKRIVTGGAIIAAVAADALRRRLDERRG